MQDDESGGVSGGVAQLAKFASCVVKELDSWDDNVGIDRIRIAAVAFATNASIDFAFSGPFEVPENGHDRNVKDVQAALSQIRYSEDPSILTLSRLDLGLEAVRKGLVGNVRSGYRGNYLHIIVLTDHW